MDEIDNRIDFSDEEEISDDGADHDDQTCKCKNCKKDFSSGDKGCSVLKELCPKCHTQESAELLAALDEDKSIVEGKDICIQS